MHILLFYIVCINPRNNNYSRSIRRRESGQRYRKCLPFFRGNSNNNIPFIHDVYVR